MLSIKLSLNSSVFTTVFKVSGMNNINNNLDSDQKASIIGSKISDAVSGERDVFSIQFYIPKNTSSLFMFHGVVHIKNIKDRLRVV
jgi:hypothetical protein